MIYLDNAATSHPKPPGVSAAMTGYLEAGGNPGRSGHRLARAAEAAVWDARQALADLLQVDQPERIVFCNNATTALNVAIKGLVKPGDRVLTSSFEHNAVVRPLHTLQEVQVRTTLLPPGDDSPVDLNRLDAELAAGDVSLIVMCHASNVTGAVVPLRAIRDLAAAYAVPLVVDAAQTVGHIPVRGEDGDVVVFAGHKGLYGPQGTGGMSVSERVTVRPLIQGGTGGRSELPSQPRWLPHALESGTPNGVGIAGLAAGVHYVASQGLSAIGEREQVLRRTFVAVLGQIPGVRLYEWPSPEPPVPVVSVSFDGLAANDAAALLEERHEVLVRGGLHCAPLAHRTLDTAAHGTVRFALSHLTTDADLDAAAAAVADIAKLCEVS